VTDQRKLIEVALPLEAINREAAREKSIRHGHPSMLHLWWARRPLAACRAVLFASLIDDPSCRPDIATPEEADRERDRLFRLIERLVTWEATTDEQTLEEARTEIQKGTRGKPPPVLDPFSGGGSIVLEAQRLGLEAHASDLNPVAALITRALVELPPKFRGLPPVNPNASPEIAAQARSGSAGLAEDVRFYGRWLRSQAYKSIGHLYPEVRLDVSSASPAIAWIWARIVRCPNPACGADMPLVGSLSLCRAKGREAWLEPAVDREARSVSFHVRTGHGAVPESPKIGRGGNFRCLVCGEVAAENYIKAEGLAHRLTKRLIAIVAEGDRRKHFVDPDERQINSALAARPSWEPEGDLASNPRWFSPPLFGMSGFRQLFTPRQLLALTTFADLIPETRERVRQDAEETHRRSAEAYADAVATYIGCALGRSANYWSSFTPWGGDFIVQTFGRQALPMVWDFAEANPFSESTGSWGNMLDGVVNAIARLPAASTATVSQLDATQVVADVHQPLICTDPPYYDNIGYADLSDFFYVWLRHALGSIYPDLFSTLLTPKASELVAVAHRFGGQKEAAQHHFESGLRAAFSLLHTAQSAEYPMTLFYAFKQAEVDRDGMASTGWETMLEGLLGAGFAVTGTWPMRTERDQGLKTGTSVLASSILLVCRPRRTNAVIATRKEFTTALRVELPSALRNLQSGSIAPVDLAQAAIGPGMAIFSRFARVLEADGGAMRVRAALVLINEALDELLAEQEADFDSDTRWCVAWFDQYGMSDGPFGVAETLSRAKNTAINGLVEAGIVHSRAGRVRLLDRGELQTGWSPRSDTRLTVWELTQHLIAHHQHAGEDAAAALLREVGGALSETARELAYRLFSICERKGWAQEALAYNALVTAWPEITRLAAQAAPSSGAQEALL
jgi:putative DNA methylase